MKKNLSIYLSIILLILGASCSSVYAYTPVGGNKLPGGGRWIYNANEEELFIDAETIPDYGFVTHQGGVGDPLGPETKGEKCDVTDAPWCAFAKSVKVITLSDKIQHIGTNAFRGFSEVVKVNFNPRMSARLEDEKIAVCDYAFAGCSKLENFSFRDIYHIGDYAFSHTALRYVELSDIRFVGYLPFSDCPNLIRRKHINNAASVDNYDLMPSIYFRTDRLPNFLYGSNDPTEHYLCHNSGKGVNYYIILYSISEAKNIHGGVSGVYNLRVNEDEKIFFGGDMGYNSKNARRSYWYMRTPSEMIVNYAGLSGEIQGNAYLSWTPVSQDVTKLRFNEATEVGRGAFANFNKLEEVILDPSVTEIKERAFYSCDALNKITGTDNVKYVHKEAFSNCSALASIGLPQCVEIGEQAFDGSNKLSWVYIPAVQSLGDMSFADCPALNTITFSSAPRLGNDVFYGVKRSKVTLRISPSAASAFSSNIWSGFNIEYLTADLPLNDDGWSLSKEGQLVISDLKWFRDYVALEQLPWHAYRDLITSVVVADNMSSTKVRVGDFMFSDLPNLEKVSLGEVAEVGKYAFSQCPKLNTVGTTLNHTTKIGDGAFEGCTSLSELYLGISLTSLGQLVFYGCQSLKELSCAAATPPAVQNNTFDGIADGNQKSVLLYSPVTSLALYVKANGWKNFSYASLKAYGNIVESGEFYDGTYLIYENGLMQCYADNNSNASSTESAMSALRTKVKEIDVQGEIMSLGPVFKNFTSLTKVTLSSSITSLTQTFDGCTNLQEISMQGVRRLGDYTFRNCSSLDLSNLTNLTHIGYNCFENSGITEVTIWNATLGANIFKGCKNLKSVHLNIPVIKEEMFKGCSALTDAYFGSNVATVEGNAFLGTAISSIIYDRARPATLDYDGYENIFSGVSANDITLYVPAPCIETFKNAATWRNMNIVENQNVIADAFTLPQSGYFAVANDSWTLAENGLLTIQADGDMTPWLNGEDILHNQLEQWIPYVTTVEVMGETTSTVDDMIPSDRGNGIPGITKIALGKNIKTVGRSFYQLYHLERVDCYAEEVPGIYDEAFDWNVIADNSVKLHVPNKPGVRDAYRQNSNWKKFQIIADLDDVYTVTLNADYGYIETQEDVNLNAVPKNTVLHLTAVPASGYRFVEWGNYNPATGLKVTDDVTVTATFERIITGIEDVTFGNNESNNQVRKLLLDGQLIILMPEGKIYNIQGQRIK